MAPRFSVISTARNTRPDLVGEMASSVAAAARQYGEAVELVMVNDGSHGWYRREYASILKSPMSHVRPKLLNTGPRGIAAGRNLAAKSAEGEWLCVVDSDDLVRDDFFRQLSGGVLTKSSFVFTDHVKVTFDLSRLVEHRRKGRYLALLAQHAGGVQDPFLHGTFLVHCHVMHSSLFDRVGWFNESIRYGDEVDFHLRVSARLDAHEFGHVPEPIYVYRDNPDGVCRDEENYRELINSIESILLDEARFRGLQASRCSRHGKRPDGSVAYVYS